MKRVLLAAVTVILLAGCGGRSEATVEVNSGEPPGMSPASEKAALLRQVKERNDDALVACSVAGSSAHDNLWDCKVTPAGKNASAEIEVMGVGYGGLYEITECRLSPHQAYSQMPRGVCKEVH